MISDYRQPEVPLRKLDEVMGGLRRSEGVASILTARPSVYHNLPGEGRRVLPYYCPSSIRLESIDRTSKEIKRSKVRDWLLDPREHLRITGEREIDWGPFLGNLVDILNLSFVIDRKGVIFKVTRDTQVTLRETDSEILIDPCNCGNCLLSRRELDSNLGPSVLLRSDVQSFRDLQESAERAVRAVRGLELLRETLLSGPAWSWGWYEANPSE